MTFDLLHTEPGILTPPDDTSAWSYRLRRRANITGGWQADGFDYFAQAVYLDADEERRAKAIAAALNEYDTARIRRVCHSNGGDLFVRSLPYLDVWLGDVFLVAPACEADCEVNGINEWLRKGWMQSLTVIVAGHDHAAKWAELSRLMLVPFVHRFGAMLQTGPTNIDPKIEPGRFNVVKRDSWDHSSFEQDPNWEPFVRMVLARPTWAQAA